MQLSARYVDQHAIYDCPILGRLTDRRIAFYKKRGHYGQQAMLERKTKRAKRSNNNAALKALLEGLT